MAGFGLPIRFVARCCWVQRLRVICHLSHRVSHVLGTNLLSLPKVDVEESAGRISEIPQGIEINSVGIQAETSYDNTQDDLGHFIGGPPETRQ